MKNLGWVQAMVSYPACQGALQNLCCVSNRWTCKKNTVDKNGVLSHSVTVSLHSHLHSVFPPLIFRSRPSPRSSLCLLLHIPLQNSALACSPLPGQLLTMWSTCWWKNQLVKPTFFLFTEQKNTNWLFKVMQELPNTKPNDLAEMFTFQLFMWVLCRQNPN